MIVIKEVEDREFLNAEKEWNDYQTAWKAYTKLTIAKRKKLPSWESGEFDDHNWNVMWKKWNLARAKHKGDEREIERWTQIVNGTRQA